MSVSVKKKVDPQVRIVLENGVKNKHRSMIVMIGERGIFQVPTIHKLLTKFQASAPPKILWCYKVEQKYSSNQEKRNKELKKVIEKGLLVEEEANPFHLFMSSNNITWCKYKDTHRILGQTFGMLVLQDFSEITPNNLARTIETVSGGGTVLFLLDKFKDLESIYKVSMAFHRGMRTDAFGTTTNRFIKRFIDSFSKCQNCIVIDDEFNKLSAVHSEVTEQIIPHDDTELEKVKREVENIDNIGPITQQTYTIDQARTVLHIIEVIQGMDVTNKVIGITAARGRGKSAALGLALAAAISFGYSNIFVTAPTPSNLSTLFKFVITGFDALNYKDKQDYETVINPETKNIIRINVFHAKHRQTITYIKPQDAHLLSQCEILAIDEAAAIPLPFVRKLLGPYFVFLSSTVNGYEGTGRALSLKLFEELKQFSHERFTESELTAPIRYAPNDPIEAWLHKVLCLDAQPEDPTSFPAPSACELMYINRDILFSGHEKAEDFLSSLVALSVASHYKNEPDDLILMSDTPNHRLFALIGPIDPNSRKLPQVICYIQIALEGKISKSTQDNAQNRGKSPDGDLIPWTVRKYYSFTDIAEKTGIRIVRIAVHPKMQGKGYGGRAIEQLLAFYSNQIVGEITPDHPLLKKLENTEHEEVDYAGVSFGLTLSLFKFWRRSGFVPVYINQKRNEMTGEFSSIVLKDFHDTFSEQNDKPSWLEVIVDDFKNRFSECLGFQFKDFPPYLLDAIYASMDDFLKHTFETNDFRSHDLRRLEQYSKQQIEYPVVEDLMSKVARYYFEKNPKIKGITNAGKTVLMIIGLQHTSVQECADRLNIQVNQVYAIIQRSLGLFVDYFKSNDNQNKLPKSTDVPIKK